MEALMKNKGTLAAVVIIIAAFFAYNSFFNSDTAPAGEANVSASVLGADLLKLSEEISKATLSREIFSDSSYRYLTDFSVPVPAQPVGRINPFNLIGR